MQKYAIMMIGKTHSGKTTLARQLAKNLRGIVLETDNLALFLKKEFPIDFDADKEHSGSFDNPSLKIKLFETILEHAIATGCYLPILSNSNLHQKLRDKLIEKLHRHDYEVIGIFLDLPRKVLRERVEIAQKDTGVLNVSKDFNVLLDKQRKILAKPKAEEFDYFLEVKKEEDIQMISGEIQEIIKSNSLKNE